MPNIRRSGRRTAWELRTGDTFEKEGRTHTVTAVGEEPDASYPGARFILVETDTGLNLRLDPNDTLPFREGSA